MFAAGEQYDDDLGKTIRKTELLNTTDKYLRRNDTS